MQASYWKRHFHFVFVLVISISVLSICGTASESPQSSSAKTHNHDTNLNKSANGKKNILFLLPLSSKSHKHVFEPLIRGLAAKGHEITVIAATKSPNMPPNVREIVIVKDEEIFDAWEDPLENRKKGKFGNMFMDISFAINVCNKVYESEELQSLLKTHKNKFDLAFIDIILNQCFYGLLKYFESPYITLATLPPWDAVASTLGSHLPSSFIPMPFFEFTESMTFMQRVKNNLLNFVVPLIMRFAYNQKLEKVYQEKLGSDYPPVETIEGNASMMLTNSHFSLNPKMPLLPDIVEVGGMHLKPAKALPKDLEDFLADANDGFIFFSLGSIVRAKNMPEETRKTFLKAFSKLKQKVIWKWEVDSMPDLPPNVIVRKWLPQQDILGHSKIKLFISHGGLLSLQEAVYHGVPVLGVPVFGDQDINIIQAVNSGFGLHQEILSVNEGELLDKINQLLTEPRFTIRAQQISKIIRDQPQSPLERAVFWSEYVMRHQGAHHLRSPARELNWIQYHSIDVAAFFISIFISLLLVLKCVCKRLCCASSKLEKSNLDDKSYKKKYN